MKKKTPQPRAGGAESGPATAGCEGTGRVAGGRQGLRRNTAAASPPTRRALSPPESTRVTSTHHGKALRVFLLFLAFLVHTPGSILHWPECLLQTVFSDLKPNVSLHLECRIKNNHWFDSQKYSLNTYHVTVTVLVLEMEQWIRGRAPDLPELSPRGLLQNTRKLKPPLAMASSK